MSKKGKLKLSIDQNVLGTQRKLFFSHHSLVLPPSFCFPLLPSPFLPKYLESTYSDGEPWASPGAVESPFSELPADKGGEGCGQIRQGAILLEPTVKWRRSWLIARLLRREVSGDGGDQSVDGFAEGLYLSWAREHNSTLKVKNCFSNQKWSNNIV